MRISFAPSDQGLANFRQAVDSLGGRVGRVWLTDNDPTWPGEAIDAMIRFAEYDSGPNAIWVQRWDREANERTTGDVIVQVDRIHMY